MPALPRSPHIVSEEERANVHEMQRHITLASEMASRGEVSFTDALISLSQPEASLSTDDPLWCEVDEMQFDEVIRALMVDQAKTYMELLEQVPEWAERAWEPRGTLRLSAVLAKGGTTLGRVHTLMAADRQAIALEASKTPAPDNEVDDEGHALLRPGEDPDELLADPVAPRRAFRRAHQLGVLAERYGDPQVGEVVGEGSGFEDFEREWRLAVDAGWDLVATLQLEDQGQNDALAAIDKAAKVDAKVRQERKEKEAAERKQLEETAEKLRQKYPGSDRVNT